MRHIRIKGTISWDFLGKFLFWLLVLLVALGIIIAFKNKSFNLVDIIGNLR